MNRLAILGLGFLLMAAGVAARVYRADLDWLNRTPTPLTPESARQALEGMPLIFEENRGQVDSQVVYFSRNGSSTIYFTESEIVYQLMPASESDKAVALRQTFIGGQSPYTVVGVDPLTAKVNYFIGNDESKWVKQASTFSSVKYVGVYEGIDIQFEGRHGRLDYTIMAKPHADLNALQIQVAGADRLGLAVDGSLVFVTPVGNIGLPPPKAQQIGDTASIAIEYTLTGDQQFRFTLGEFDRTRDIIISTVSNQ